MSALARLREQLPDALGDWHDRLGDETVVVAPERLDELMACLREDEALAFDMLMDVTAVDRLEQGGSPRFEVVYHLYSSGRNHRLRVKVGVDLGPEAGRVPSVTRHWPAADWLEREVWDLYGIGFDGHPDLRRILLYEEFEGHPLRKDYEKARAQPLPRLADRDGAT